MYLLTGQLSLTHRERIVSLPSVCLLLSVSDCTFVSAIAKCAMPIHELFYLAKSQVQKECAENVKL